MVKSSVLETQKFSELAAPAPDPNADNRTNVLNSPVYVKLPKLNLREFLADFLWWPSFGGQFSVTVQHTALSIVSKFTYLLLLMEREPQQVISSISPIPDHYTNVWKYRFAGKRRWFSPIFENIFLHHPNVLFRLYGYLMMNYRHTVNHLTLQYKW